MPENIVRVYCTWHIHIFVRELNITDSGTRIFYEKALELCTPFYSIYLCWLVVKQVCIKNLLSRGLLQVLLWPISICAMDKIHIWIWTELYFQKVYETELFIFIRCGVISAQFFFRPGVSKTSFICIKKINELQENIVFCKLSQCSTVQNLPWF